MIISYKKAIPDHGVTALGNELRDLIGELNSNLTGKINALDIRVSALEQTGTLTISGAIVDNDNRSIAVSVIATDHTVGTNVTFNVTDENDVTVSDVETLVLSTDGEKQLASTTLDLSSLAEGSLNIVASSQDQFGKARTDTAIRTYAPAATAISVASVNFDPISRLVTVAADLDIGYPVNDLLGSAGATLKIVNSSNPSEVIAQGVVATRQVSGVNRLVWDDVSLVTDATEVDFIIDATDAYGDAVQGSRTNVDISDSQSAAVRFHRVVVNQETYIATVEAIVWYGDTATLKLSNAGGTATQSQALATVTPYNDPDDELTDYSFAEHYKWTVSVAQLAADTISVQLTSNDTNGRSATISQPLPYAPLGRLQVAGNTINSAAKTLDMTFSSRYISVGQTATVVLSSAINGYSETHTVVMGDTTFAFGTVDVSGFPFGRINQNVTVEDQVGNTASWDGYVTFSDVQGDIVDASSGVSSVSDVATARWRQTGNVTVNRVIVTDKNGATVESTEAPTSPNDGTAYKLSLDISSLAYGTVTIRIEGLDGGNRVIEDTTAHTYANREGYLSIASFDFNPTSRTARIQGTYINIEPGTSIRLVHWPQGNTGAAVTENLQNSNGEGQLTYDGTFSYSYADNTVVEYYLLADDVKGESVSTTSGTINTGESGSINLVTSLDNVAGKLTLSGNVNGTVSVGKTVNLNITGASTLSSSATVTSGRTFSKVITLPPNYGTLNITASVVDVYNKTITDTASVNYQSVNGGISVNSVATTSPSSAVTVAGTVSNVANGATVNVNLYEKGSSTVRASGTAVVSGNSWEGVIAVSGGVDTPNLPYGQITAKASVSDLGGTSRIGSRDGVFTAAAGHITASVESRDLVNNIIKIRVSWTNIAKGGTIAAQLRVDGSLLNNNITSITSSTGNKLLTFDFDDNISGQGTPDLDFNAIGFDYNENDATAELSNISWSNAATIAITSANIAANTDQLTVQGTMTNVQAGTPVTIKATDVNGGTTVATTVTLNPSSNTATFSKTFDIGQRANGSLQVRVEARDQQSQVRSALTSVSWQGHGSISAHNASLSYSGAGVGTITASASISGTWAANPDWKARLYYYDDDDDSTATLWTTVTPSVNGGTLTMTNTTVNIPHGAQMYVQFEGTDAAGARRTAKTGNRSAMTHSLKASFSKAPTRVGTASDGKSIFEYAIANYLTHSLYQGTNPTTTYKTPTGTTITVNETLHRWVGTTAYFRFNVDDRSLSGDYLLKARWSTGQSQPGNYISIGSDVTYVKEDPVSLSVTSFYVKTRYASGRTIPNGFYATGVLDAPSASGKTIYVEIKSDYSADDKVTYTDQTDSTGRWTVSSNSTDGVYQIPGGPVNCTARVTYGGKTVYSNTRGSIWPIQDDQNPL